MVAALHEFLDERQSLTTSSSVRRGSIGMAGVALLFGFVTLQIVVGAKGGALLLGAALAAIYLAGTVSAAAIGERVTPQRIAFMGALHVLGTMLATL